MSTKAPGVFGAPKTSAASSSLFETAKNAVIEIYEKHNPAKLSEVDSLLAKYAGKEGELVSRLRAKYLATPQLFVSTPEDAPGSRVYMDFMDTDGKQLGRVKYRLYDTNTPLTANNFRSLCTGELVC
jgi:phosphoribosyl-dephospho-CoA transferase